MKRYLIPALLITLFVLAACGGARDIEPTLAPAAATVAPRPTATLAPVDTPIPPADTPATVTLAPTAAPEPTALPAPQDEAPAPQSESPLPVPSAEPISEPAPTDWSEVETRTAEGFYERGNPDAPILILDYSDFL